LTMLLSALITLYIMNRHLTIRLTKICL